MATKWNDTRPMSPHLQIWRWHPAMLSSILHRACAIIAYVLLIIVAVGLLIFSTTGKLPLETLIFSPLGAMGAFVGVFAFTFMALAQLRHAVWDRGALFDPKLNNALSWVMIFVSGIVAAVFIGVVASAGAA